MLINEPQIKTSDPILSMVASVSGRTPTAKTIKDGMYEVGHFGGSHILPNYNHYPELTIGCYGVCDTSEQLLQKCPELEDSGRKFIVTFTPIKKSDEPPSGGWRWHKWGEYIGDQNPQCEYIYDEKDIELVYVYHIYEKQE